MPKLRKGSKLSTQNTVSGGNDAAESKKAAGSLTFQSLQDAIHRKDFLEREVKKLNDELAKIQHEKERLGSQSNSFKSEIQARISKFGLLRTQHSQIIEKATKLILDARLAALSPSSSPDPNIISIDDWVLIELGAAVERHRNRKANGSKYLKDVSEGISLAGSLAGQVRKLVEKLNGLDDSHRRELQYLLKEMSLGAVEVDTQELVAQLMSAATIMSLTSKALMCCEHELPRGRGRTRNGYDHAAFDLVDVWERLTGARVVFPEQFAEGQKGMQEPVEPATNFVLFGLQLIAPQITNSEVRTCLRNALNMRLPQKEKTHEPSKDSFFEHAAKVIKSRHKKHAPEAEKLLEAHGSLKAPLARSSKSDIATAITVGLDALDQKTNNGTSNK